MRWVGRSREWDRPDPEDLTGMAEAVVERDNLADYLVTLLVEEYRMNRTEARAEVIRLAGEGGR